MTITYEPINQYRNLFNNPKIKEIDKLNKYKPIRDLSDEINDICGLAEKTIKALSPTEWTETNGYDEYKYFKASPHQYYFFSYSNTTTGDDEHDDFDSFINDTKKIELLDDTSKYIAKKIKESELILNKRFYLRTRIPLGIVDKELLSFFNCPVRTKIGTKFNLIIETTKYGINYRIPALHYWDMRPSSERVYLTQKKLDVLKIIFYDEIKKGLIEHKKKSNTKLRNIKKRIKKLKEDLNPYFIVGMI